MRRNRAPKAPVEVAADPTPLDPTHVCHCDRLYDLDGHPLQYRHRLRDHVRFRAWRARNHGSSR